MAQNAIQDSVTCLENQDRSQATLRTYRGDLIRFAAWFEQANTWCGYKSPRARVCHVQGETEMIQENEVVMAALGLGVSILVLVNRYQLKRIPSSRILIIGFSTLVAGWVLTVLEGFFWDTLLNFLEHMCYAISSILVTAWCWKVFGKAKEGG